MASQETSATQPPPPAPKRNAPKRNTKDRILDAALETVRAQGLIGASARAIARTGDFNQALVFYHYGSVEELLLAALERASSRRIARFEDRLNAVDDLAGLVQVAAELRGDVDDPDTPALSAIVAGWSNASDLGPRILQCLEPWNELVEGAITRALADSPFGKLVPAADIAWTISALYLGIEMMARLDPEDARADRLFASLAGIATLVEPLLNSKRITEQ